VTASHHVVIIGGGFGGMNAARGLGGAPVRVTLIDRRNFHLFQPLLYQVASGGLSPGDITAPLRHVVREHENVSVLLAEVIRIEVPRRTIHLDGGAGLRYDTLVVAAGARNYYFGNEGWEKWAPGLKSIEDATEIRARILGAFEAAEREEDPAIRKEWLRFVVVGAGPTGVELAGAIAEISRDTLRGDFRRIRPEESEILLLEGSPRLLPAFQPDLSANAERALFSLGVRTRTGMRVTAIDSGGVNLSGSRGPERIASRTVLWAAGVRMSPLGEEIAAQTGAETDRSGRVRVEADLSIRNHPEILVIGDLAHFEQDGEPLPGLCPVAIQQGWHVRKVIAARAAGQPAPAFRYSDKGTMATIGRNKAVADLGFVRFGGRLAWLAWLFIHLLYIVGFENRVLIALKWGFQYLTFNRGARLITGAGAAAISRDRSAPGKPSQPAS
jgi:NADH dehydrogenase